MKSGSSRGRKPNNISESLLNRKPMRVSEPLPEINTRFQSVFKHVSDINWKVVNIDDQIRSVMGSVVSSNLYLPLRTQETGKERKQESYFQAICKHICISSHHEHYLFNQ